LHNETAFKLSGELRTVINTDGVPLTDSTPELNKGDAWANGIIQLTTKILNRLFMPKSPLAGMILRIKDNASGERLDRTPQNTSGLSDRSLKPEWRERGERGERGERKKNAPPALVQ
jgi:hypothetical protein